MKKKIISNRIEANDHIGILFIYLITQLDDINLNNVRTISKKTDFQREISLITLVTDTGCTASKVTINCRCCHLCNNPHRSRRCNASGTCYRL